jgi:hypothetical protein
MWNKNTADTDSAEKNTSAIGIKNALKIKGVPLVLLIFVILMILMSETLNRTLRNRRLI